MGVEMEMEMKWERVTIACLCEVEGLENTPYAPRGLARLFAFARRPMNSPKTALAYIV